MTRLSVFSLLLASTSAMAADAMHGMDHSQMPGMDHSAMQSMDDGMMQPAAPSESRTPIAPVTDADRAAVFTSPGGHQVHDSVINSYFLADKLEWQNADDGSALAQDLSGWIGGDTDRLWLRSEGERNNGKTEDAEIQALWGHAISPWWDVVGGVRQDLKPGAPQTGPRSACKAWRCTTSRPKPRLSLARAARARYARGRLRHPADQSTDPAADRRTEYLRQKRSAARHRLRVVQYRGGPAVAL